MTKVQLLKKLEKEAINFTPDFLLSKGLLLAVKNEEFDLLKIMSKAVQEMSEGELLQIEKARKFDINETVLPFMSVLKSNYNIIGFSKLNGP